MTKLSNRALALKVGLIGLLVLLLLVPLEMLDGLVAEREARSLEVAAEISASSGGAQRLVGPLLLVEQTRQAERRETVSEDGSVRQVLRQERVEEQRVVLPTRVRVEAALGIQRRGRGPYEALLFRGQHRVVAEFAAVDPAAGVTIDAARLVFAVSDSRGIRAVQATLDREPLSLQAGTTLAWMPSGLRSELAVERLAEPLDFELDLDLAGAGAWSWMPAAEESRVTVRGDWPHPSFAGIFLPDAPEITPTGFQATWTISAFAGAGNEQLRRCLPLHERCDTMNAGGFGFGLLEPVDRYAMTDRALKYALLFLALVFGAVFFIEVTATVRIHPMQYALVGLALAIFYLLLLALAEHVGFALAYGIAALACSGLISVYLAAAVGSRARHVALTVLLLLLYGLLYGILQLEDFALLLGAGVLFALLAGVMLATRGFDWSTFGAAETTATSQS